MTKVTPEQLGSLLNEG